jgi:peptidyl-prolyl cis-trans isomerase C
MARPTPAILERLFSMNSTIRAAATISLMACVGMALAQNVAIVNGKPVTQARVDALITQMTRNGQQPKTPEMESRAKEEAVMREILEQEAERRGVQGNDGFKQQLELARQSILINELIADQRKKVNVTDDEIKAEYDKVAKSQGPAGTEYRARHILVESEAQAKSLITQIKKGGSFEALAKKHSKDPGSGAKGGDLDFARPDAYVPEFGQAMAALKKGQTTDAPVKSQFGWHIIKLEDTRESQLPPLDAVKPQLKQRLEQQRMQSFVDGLKSSAKTDFKFAPTQP